MTSLWTWEQRCADSLDRSQERRQERHSAGIVETVILLAIVALLVGGMVGLKYLIDGTGPIL